MRIIAGKYKGRKLKSVEGQDTRPTLDRVRENIFNIIGGSIIGAHVLDLFSGTGAIGIEALSRGASDVVFCDSARSAVSVIRENLRTVKEDREVLFSDYKEALRALRGRTFDFIYLDPPYDFTPDIAAISDLLLPDGRIIFEHSAEKQLKLPSDSLIITDERRYGIAVISFIKRAE